jgi:hypothetical protein
VKQFGVDHGVKVWMSHDSDVDIVFVAVVVVDSTLLSSDSN